jgi:hypothetical protein
MKNVPEDYRIEDLLDVQTIVSIRFCYVTVLMLISTSTPELLERVSPEQESRRAQTLELSFCLCSQDQNSTCSGLE